MCNSPNACGKCECFDKYSRDEKDYVIKQARQVLRDNHAVRDRMTLAHNVISYIAMKHIPFVMLEDIVPDEVDRIILSNCGEDCMFKHVIVGNEWPNDFIAFNDEGITEAYILQVRDM